MPSPIQLRRDPFARATLYRIRSILPSPDCTWCGSHPARWYYYWVQDGSGSRTFPLESCLRPFCSIDCWADYYGERRR